MNKYIDIAKEISLKHFSDIDIEIFLFGSRADGSEFENSDIDIGLLGNKGISKNKINRLYEKLEESIVPYHIDIIDFFNVNDEFKRIALHNKTVWKRKKNIN